MKKLNLGSIGLAMVLVLLAAVIARAELPMIEAAARPAKDSDSLAEKLDAYLDRRWLPPDEAEESTRELVAALEAAGVSTETLEQMLLAGRAQYEPFAGKKNEILFRDDLACDHVDYTSKYFLFVPEIYDPARAAPLILIGHGGNGAMPRDYAKRAAKGNVTPWIEAAKKHGFILAAPLTERGWGPIGDSLLLTLLSRLSRELHLDPNRVYVTGHSMGGHLSWRSGLHMPDRWAAVSPMSGGYDYVENEAVHNLLNVPGYSTFGVKEPYNIDVYNRKIAIWMKEHRFDWRIVEKKGGHEIFAHEIPRVAEFFLARPRNLYPKQVYFRVGPKPFHDRPGENEKWKAKHTWQQDRPILLATAHWVRLFALPDDTPEEHRIQKVHARREGNSIVLASQNVRRTRIYLHPEMVDFEKPVQIIANGKAVFEGRVKPSMTTLLDLVREFDDRGRIFYAHVDVRIENDGEVAPPVGDAEVSEEEDAPPEMDEKTVSE